MIVSYRLRLHAVGTATPADGTVSYTFADFAETPDYGGQSVQPLEGSTSLGRWSFRIVDTSGALTTALSDPSTGRAHLLGRLAEVQESIDGGAWSTVAVGRLAAVTMDSGAPHSYGVSIEDERYVERSAKVFDVADTCNLWPAGLRYPWRGTGGTGSAEVLSVSASGSVATIRAFSSWPLSTRIAQWIEDDLVDEPDLARTDGEGNFQHLRARVGETDYPVLGFGPRGALTKSLDEAASTSADKMNSELGFSVWDPGGAIQTGDSIVLWAPTASPSDTLPLHVGTWIAVGDPHEWGGFPNPLDLLQAVYDEAGVRYDASAFTALAGRYYPRVAVRITSPDLTVAEFAERHIYAPLGLIPFVDNLGRISPRPVRVYDDAFDFSDPFRFDASNTVTPPSFDHALSEAANAVTITGRKYRKYGYVGGQASGQLATPARPLVSDFAADYLDEIEISRGPTRRESSTTDAGERTQEYDLSGVMAPGEGLFEDWDLELGITTWRTLATAIETEVLERFADGSQRGRLTAMRTPQDGSGRTPLDVNPGDVVELNFDTYPNLATQARGGLRYVQVLSRRVRREGVEFEFLDIGAGIQPPAAPSGVTVVQNAADPEHAVDVTVSGIPSGSEALVEVAHGAADALSPTTEWAPTTVDRIAATSGTVTLEGLPSDREVFVRARSVDARGLRSLATTPASVTTATISAPTGLTVVTDSETSTTARLTWNVDDPDLPLEVWIAGALVDELPPGSSGYFAEFLTPSSSVSFQLRYIDPYGGVGAFASTTISTTSSQPLAPPLEGLAVVVGVRA